MALIDVSINVQIFFQRLSAGERPVNSCVQWDMIKLNQHGFVLRCGSLSILYPVVFMAACARLWERLTRMAIFLRSHPGTLRLPVSELIKELVTGDLSTTSIILLGEHLEGVHMYICTSAERDAGVTDLRKTLYEEAVNSDCGYFENSLVAIMDSLKRDYVDMDQLNGQVLSGIGKSCFPRTHQLTDVFERNRTADSLRRTSNPTIISKLRHHVIDIQCRTVRHLWSSSGGISDPKPVRRGDDDNSHLHPGRLMGPIYDMSLSSLLRDSRAFRESSSVQSTSKVESPDTTSSFKDLTGLMAACLNLIITLRWLTEKLTSNAIFSIKVCASCVILAIKEGEKSRARVFAMLSILWRTWCRVVLDICKPYCLEGIPGYLGDR
jgi:hypothetical protein